MKNDQFSKWIITWFRQHGRRGLPWQCGNDPYPIWISEIMLQQTQVNTVIPYFHRFIQKFPTVQALAESETDEVLCVWSGLGYYSRGRNLHRAARIIHHKHGGVIPHDKEQLMALPGIGRSTAGAILALSFKQRHAILDGNVKRVLSRFYAVSGWPGKAKVTKRLWQLAETLTPEIAVDQYTQAIMDLGATICRLRQPKCEVCPVAKGCTARRKKAQHCYPTPRPKKILPLRKIIFLLLYKKTGEVLLEKRPATGVWGGLWCFPECRFDEDVSTYLSTTTGYYGIITKKLPAIQHTLTHFRMEIVPVCLRAIGRQRQVADHLWHLPEQVTALAVPVPVKRLLQDHGCTRSIYSE